MASCTLLPLEPLEGVAGSPELCSRRSGCSLPQRSALPHLGKGGECRPPPGSRLPPQGPRRAQAVAEPHCRSVAAEGKAPLGSGGRGPNSGAGTGGGGGGGGSQVAINCSVSPSPEPSASNFLGRFAAWDVLGVPEERNGVFTCVLAPLPSRCLRFVVEAGGSKLSQLTGFDS